MGTDRHLQSGAHRQGMRVSNRTPTLGAKLRARFDRIFDPRTAMG